MPVKHSNSVLAKVTTPRDLDGLTTKELNRLADEIRHVLIRDVRQVGGHLGSNAGVVELTIALHRVFDSPRDPILFDVGHQSYVHKMLTGRHNFSTIRQRGGLSGYPNRAESVHDVIESSHAASALSWGVGLAQSYALSQQPDRTVVVVLGDGSLTGGTTWEALNNIDPDMDNLVVVLNDNGVSYAPTVGSIAQTLVDLRKLHAPAGARERPENLFTMLGMTYVGPVDGHNLDEVERALARADQSSGPVLVHVITEKARGVELTEAEQHEHAHTVTGQAPEVERTKASERPSRWTDVFSAQLSASAATHPDLVAISAAMVRSTGLSTMAERFPKRVFDVGIAEQHAVTAAAGMAYAGLHPVVAIYSTFLMRAIDQVLMDVALHRAPVIFVLDRAGVTGPDGPSHHGQWDLSLLSMVPGMRIAVPRDAGTLQQALTEAFEYSTGPTALRFPTGEVPARIEPVQCYDDGAELLYAPNPESAGNADLGDVLICSIGPFAHEAIAVARRARQAGLTVSVMDPRWAHPMPSTVLEAAKRHRGVLTIEDGVRSSGIGAQLARKLSTLRIPVLCLGLPEEFISHGKREEILSQAGLTEAGLETAVWQLAQSSG